MSGAGGLLLAAAWSRGVHPAHNAWHGVCVARVGGDALGSVKAEASGCE